jgi:hypothetical protein
MSDMNPAHYLWALRRPVRPQAMGGAKEVEQAQMIHPVQAGQAFSNSCWSALVQVPQWGPVCCGMGLSSAQQESLLRALKHLACMCNVGGARMLGRTCAKGVRMSSVCPAP